LAKVHVKKGDTVVVLSGKDKGKRGKVLRVIAKKGVAIVEGVNVATKHQKPSPKNPQGGIVHQEMPLNTSKLMVVCNKCGMPTRIGHTFLADGTKVRTCKKCGEVLDSK